MRLTNRVALVTGAGAEIGSEVAQKLAREGAHVAVCDSRHATAERVKAAIKKEKGSALAVEADLGVRSQVDAMVAKILHKWGRIDILINNMGRPHDEPFLDMSFLTWKEIFETHLDGYFNCTQSVARHMARNHYGKIVNFSAPGDMVLFTGEQGVNDLSESAAVERMTTALAKELGKYGITINCIVPGYIETEMLRTRARPAGLYLDDLKKLATSIVPLGRLGSAQEVAAVALFLASDESSFVSGQIIHVKGGP